MSNATPRGELKACVPIVHRVPEEILRAIFIAVIDIMNILWDSKLYHTNNCPPLAHGSLAISHVCAAWRTIARDYSQLWCDIDLVEPQLAQLCLELSNPHNIHVFCRASQKTFHQEPRPEYLTVLERVFKESARIETLRLSDYPGVFPNRPYYQHGILPIVTRLDAAFPSLKTLRGMEWEKFTDSEGHVLAPDLSPLVKGASASLRELELPWCALSLDVFFSLQSVVELKIHYNPDFQLDDWRRLFRQLAPTLQHLVIRSDGIEHMNPPVTLPALETLHIRGSGHAACASLHVPQATQITIEDSDRFADDKEELFGGHYSVAINQRLTNISALHHPFHLIYLHCHNITVSNGDVEFAFEVTCTIRMLAFLCFGFHPALRHTITGLELSCVTTADPFTGKEDALNHSSNYRQISEYLSGLEEIHMDAGTAADFLLWLTCPENRTAFSTVKSIKLSYFGHEAHMIGQTSMVPILVEMQNMRMESGHPIQLALVAPGEVSQETLYILRKGGHIVQVDVDVDVRPSALV